MPADNSQFYAQLPINRMPLGELLVSDALFADVPANWHVVVTDIKNSTKSVLNGSHENVNLIATGSIVTVLNIAFGMGVTVPFFFGGDGATFILPPEIIEQAMQALAAYKMQTQENFGLELRTGTIPVKDIYEAGHHLHIARFSSSETFFIPVVLGNGLNHAERIIKGEDYMLAATGATTEPDLSGMQCRWDRIAPPENKEEVVSLLVVALPGHRQSEVFKEVIDAMDNIYGPPQKRQPISVAKLRFNSTFSKISTEMIARIGRVKWLQLLKTWATGLFGYLYFHTRNGKKYLKSLVEMADTLVIDGKINTVISGTTKQRNSLTKVLDELEADGKLIYGLHVSRASIMSCYVRDLKDGHIHFVDGSEGGYTQAARMLKGKVKK
ncbi:DUF3095 domain-containing protein [Mucilaginibacter pedocola]|uniref:DUF3095 domain-containing protein n=1 Tax=Mucilaginibacter pedocola TaxID=1792845 RepID=A0A1S9PBA9_9SPHI|nr:DUF3095 domain-containing protein [Mucilaginibacter pedocola]OOQ58264.1 hypothetical protein BC343_11545 [Mucilaginibacter pedocola]